MKFLECSLGASHQGPHEMAMGCKTIKLIVIAALLFPVTLGYDQSPQPNEKKAAPNAPVSILRTLLRDPVSMLDFGLYKAQLDLAAKLPDLNKRLHDHMFGPKWEERDRAEHEKRGWDHERIETAILDKQKRREK